MLSKEFITEDEFGFDEPKVNPEDMSPEDERVAAVSQLLIDKTEEADSESTISTEAFVNMMNKMGVAMTTDTLMDMVQDGDLANIVKDVSQDTVTFNGKNTIEQNAAMTKDRAEDVVGGMAKSSAKKNI